VHRTIETGARVSLFEMLRRSEPPRCAAMEPPEHMPGKGEAWCGKCEAWTDRDGLPGIPESRGQGGVTYGAVPPRYFCVSCGTWDFGFEPGGAA
jgi:hypothetical protein